MTNFCQLAERLKKQAAFIALSTNDFFEEKIKTLLAWILRGDRREFPSRKLYLED